MKWFSISDMWNSIASDFPILCQFCQVTYLSGFYDVFSSQHTACNIFSRTPDDKLGALEQKEVLFSKVLFSKVWFSPGYLLHPQACSGCLRTTKINGEKSAFS